MHWAHQKLQAEEVARTRALVNTYARTAARVGLRGGEEFK